MSGDRVDVDADADADTELDTSGEADIGTANTMRERADESRLKLWVLLSANRLLVTGTLALGVFVAFVLVGAVLYPAFSADLQSGDTVETIFSTMLGAIITATTLVVTISQVVISQENGPLGDQHTRMSDTMDFREYTENLIDQPTPADPSAFLRQLINTAQRRAQALRDSVSDSDDERLRDEVDEFTESLTGNAEEVREELDGARFGSFDVLFSALNFNYGWKIFQVERLGYEHADSLDDDDEYLLDELKTVLTMFGPAREHVKTLYFQWALIDLTQLIIYVAVPALVVACTMLAFVGPGTVAGATTLAVPDAVVAAAGGALPAAVANASLSVPHVLVVVGAGFTVTLLPFLLLVVYIARIATVAKRTLAIGPLILRDSQR